MMLGTSPGVGADAFLAASNARGVSPAARSPVPSPGSGSWTRVPGPGFGGFGGVASSPSETGNGASMLVGSQTNLAGSYTGAHRRKSADRPRPSPALAPGSGPAVVTGFDLAASSAAETTREGSRVSSSARGMSAIATSTTTREEAARKATQRSTPPPSPGGLTRGVSALSRHLETASSSSPRGANDAAKVGLLSNALELERDVRTRRPLEALEPEEAAALAALSARHAAFATPRVVSAFRVAAAAHRGDPSLLARCAETALEVAELGMREEVVAAAMTKLSFDARYSTLAPEEAERLVGVDVARLVRDACKLADVSDVSRASVRPISDDERARLRAMLLAATDARAVTIELASRLARVRRDDASAELAEETAATHVPLASRLGVWSLKARLEDACFAKTHPEAHARLSAALEADEQRAAIDAAIERFGASLADAGVAFEEMYGRPKSLASVHRKMLKKGCERVEEVHDVRAIRVIVDDEEACYAALDATLSAPGFVPVEGKTKDYVRNAKRNGYRSLHAVVRDELGRAYEVQIRTREMHVAAEYGLAAHWRYKESGEGSTSHAAVDQQVAWARFVLSWQGQLRDDRCRGGERFELQRERFAAAAAREEASEKLCAPCPCPCPFPTHDPECPNHEDNVPFGRPRGDARDVPHAWDSPLVSADSASLSKSAAGRRRDADRDPAPVYVVFAVDGRVRVLELPEGSRLSDVDLAALGADEAADDVAQSRASEFFSVDAVAVNGEEVPPGAEPAVTLRMGDLVEATTGRVRGSSPEGSPGTSAGSALGAVAAAAAEEARAKLARASLGMDVVRLDGARVRAAADGFRP